MQATVKINLHVEFPHELTKDFAKAGTWFPTSV